jgi:conjugative relaxase-like TrwC/TraI family protein
VAWMAMMGADSVDYHRATVMGRPGDHPGDALAYYGSRGETPLVWGGDAAHLLDLKGQVTPEAYEAVFGPGGARHPGTGVRLVATRRPGLELSVSVHKSVAELGVIGRADDMHRILDAERDGTLAYLEGLTKARGGRRGRSMTATPTSGLVYATTRHATSRAGDPCLHDHVLIANLVDMRDGRGGWKAADTALWRDHLHAATAFGRVRSARVAVELGYGIVADDGESGRLGHWAIAGVPGEAMAVHSKRAGEINTALDGQAAVTSFRERAVVARRTRAAKRHTPVEDLMVRWQAELADIGLHPAAIDAAVRDNDHRRVTRPLSTTDVHEIAGELLAVEGVLAERKVFTRRDIVVAAAPYVFGLDPTVLDHLVERVIASREAIELQPTVTGRERAWAPRCVVDTERAIAERADSRHRTHRSLIVAPEVVDRAIDATERRLGRPLTPSQSDTVQGVLASSRSLDVIVGHAGTGKTTVLDTIRHAHDTLGLTVYGTATSGQAARTIGRDAGIESRTVASLLARLDHARMTLDRRSVVVLDEAGMTDDADLLRLLDHTTTAGARLILVGDHRQLSAVGPGGGLEAVIARFDGRVWQLSDNVRQVDCGEREALAELRHGNINQAVEWMARHDRITTTGDRNEALGAMVDGWLADVDAGRDTVMLAWRRANVDALNELARQAGAERGWLTGPELTAAGGRRYRAGDRVVTLTPGAGRVTSQTGTVEAVDIDRHLLRVRLDDGWTTTLGRGFTSSNQLAHAYALTVHRSQGATVDTTHYLEDGGGRELAYVALSRARHHSTVYTKADDLPQAIEDLTLGWGIERRQNWVTDQRQIAPPRPPAPDDGVGIDLW